MSHDQRQQAGKKKTTGKEGTQYQQPSSSSVDSRHGTSITGSKKLESPKRSINIATKGNNYRMFAAVYFGEVNKRSEVCNLLVDTGSPLTWVTKYAYEKAILKINPKLTYPIKQGKFNMSFELNDDLGGASIFGDLYEDTITFLDDKTSVQKQTFGIVDENKLEDGVSTALREMGIVGKIGLGSNKLWERIEKYDASGSKFTERLPTILDNLKYCHRTLESIVGISIGLPDEGKTNPTDQGILTGELHFGRPKASAYEKDTMKDIPTTGEGILAVVTLELRYEGMTIMKNTLGRIDSGNNQIVLPPDVIKKYINKVKDKAGKKSVVKYDDATGFFYIAKKDFQYLTDIDFVFSRGEGHRDALFKLPPIAQVLPPALTINYPKFVKNDETVFLVLRAEEESTSNPSFILGTAWMMWHYVVLNACPGHKQLKIAEIKDRKNHRWSDLPRTNR